MKILYPQGEANDAEIEEVLRIAIEGRKRVKDQLLRIDSSYLAVRFSYFSQDGKEHLVTTLEEQEYPPVPTIAKPRLASRRRPQKRVLYSH
jgi:ATP-dependent Lon protease